MQHAATVPAPPTSGWAITSLVAGILAWCGVPILGAIVALVAGSAARSEIRNSSRGLGGEGLALAGMILGGLQLALILLALFVFVVFAALGVTLAAWPF